MPVIPFYGSDEPDLFAIERAAMDRPGRVVAALDRVLPHERVLDIGAGDGFTAARLARDVVALEPAAGMRRPGSGVAFVGGEAERLPFPPDVFDAAYSTWAYFFTGEGWDPSPGIAEVRRVVRTGGSFVVVDNLGDDGFSSYLGLPGADVAWWEANGFTVDVVDTEFSFESADDARRLLSRYLGRRVDDPPLTLDYRVGLFSTVC